MKLSTLGIGMALVASLFSVSKTAAAVEKDSIHATCGDMEFRYSTRNGVSLEVFGIPVIKSNTLYVMSPQWSKRYYGFTDQDDIIETAETKKSDKSVTIVLHHRLSGDYECPFEGTQTFTLTQNNTFTSELSFTFSEDVPAIVEWCVGKINPAPIIGKPYTAKDDDTTTRGIIPLTAKSPGVAESTVARGFSHVSIDSRMGEITIRSKPSQDLIFFDYRKNKWAQSDNPYFWLGFLDHPITSGKQYNLNISISFPEKIKLSYKAGKKKEHAPGIIPVEDARIPDTGKDYIIPAPKECEYTDTKIPLSSRTTIYTGKNPGKGIEKAVAFLLEDMRELYKIEPTIIRVEAPEDFPGGSAIILGEKPRYARPAEHCKKAGVAIPSHPEGYSITMDNGAVYIAAEQERGIFYGITTLLQLVAFEGNNIYFTGANIRDFPALDFRGVHCLSGKGAGDEIAKAIRNLMARFKLNSIVWECEYIIWDSHPEIEHPEYGMKKSEARKVVEAADQNMLELIPLIQSLGHSEWIFTNDQNLDIVEDPQTPYAYSPTNPDTYKFIFSVYQEALNFFNPKIFHIGHDEVTLKGRFPYRSKKSGKTATELIMMDTLKLHEWFAERGVRIMLWGDMFLWEDEGYDACLAPSKQDAVTRREQLPRDVIIADWHYAAQKPGKYTTLKLFKDEGFEAVGAAWYNPNNIRNLAKACVLYDAKGFLQTTWAGFNFKIDDNEEAWHQYWAYILAAHHSWTGENTEPEDLPFTAERVFMDVWFEKKPLLEKREGFMVDLTPYVNRRLDDDAKGSGWVGYGSGNDMSAFPTGNIFLEGTQFHIAKDEKGNAAVMLAGLMNPDDEFPREVVIRMKPQKAHELHFLLTTGFGTTTGKKVGSIEMTYEDSSNSSEPLIYGKNIFTYTERRTSRQTQIVWRGDTKSHKRIYMWDCEVPNPEPDRKIKSISIRSELTEAAPILLAITGVE